MLACAQPMMDEAVRKRWLHEMRQTCSEAIRQAFMMGDENGDGSLSLHEFCEAVALHRGERCPSRAAHAGHRGRISAVERDELEALFRVADRDGNGVLDFDEFLECVSRQDALRNDFDQILQLGCARKQLLAEHRQAIVFRSQISPKTHSAISPSGRRRRPSLFDLRPMHEVQLPLEVQLPDDAVAVPNQEESPA